jgi:ATP-dependent RNA helicase RhlE
MKFSEFALDPRLQKAVREARYSQPTPIQEAAIPAALKGQDILGSAETGTGKTAAYLLPLMHTLLAKPTSHRLPRALVLVPTRELALQVTEHATQLGAHTDLRVAAIFGGVSLVNQERALKRGADIVIATPGRLIDHINRRNVGFDGMQVLVLDEADRMLDVGFLPDLRRIERVLPKQRQTMLFSATLQPILELAAEVTRQPVRIEVEKAVTPDAITQALFPVAEEQKFRVLHKLLRQDGMDSVLVFSRTKHRADRIVKNLQREGLSAAVIHSNRSQNQRIAALEAFRTGQVRVLVATDIAARGIDVEGVSHVVNYDVPSQAEDYVHRIGRTGRAHATGAAYTLVTPADEAMVRKIEMILKQKIQRRRLEGFDGGAPSGGMPDAEAIRRYLDGKRAGNPSPARARAQ